MINIRFWCRLVPYEARTPAQPNRTWNREVQALKSGAYFDSEWATLEHHTLLFRDPTNAHRRFIPLLIEDCTLPDVIAQFAYIDWRGV